MNECMEKNGWIHGWLCLRLHGLPLVRGVVAADDVDARKIQETHFLTSLSGDGLNEQHRTEGECNSMTSRSKSTDWVPASFSCSQCRSAQAVELLPMAEKAKDGPARAFQPRTRTQPVQSRRHMGRITSVHGTSIH